MPVQQCVQPAQAGFPDEGGPVNPLQIRHAGVIIAVIADRHVKHHTCDIALDTRRRFPDAVCLPALPAFIIRPAPIGNIAVAPCRVDGLVRRPDMVGVGVCVLAFFPETMGLWPHMLPVPVIRIIGSATWSLFMIDRPL